MSFNGNMPAYPTPNQTRDDGLVIQWATDGLTKREALAMAALQGIVAAGPSSYTRTDKGAAEYAVRLADALLETLEKTNE